jgi:hypothetical protein
MDGQLKQMESSGKQTDKLIEHSEGQAKALIDVATASKANADALKAGDRAWLLLDYIGPDSDTEIIKQAVPSFAYKLKNHGRTPALLFCRKAEFCLGDINWPSGWLEDESFVPFEMEGGIPDGSAIPPQQPITFRAGEDRRLGEGLTIDDALAQRLIGREVFLWACGCVWYKTVHGGAMFYTRFAYRYGVYEREFFRGSFPGLNESTQ